MWDGSTLKTRLAISHKTKNTLNHITYNPVFLPEVYLGETICWHKNLVPECSWWLYNTQKLETTHCPLTIVGYKQSAEYTSIRKPTPWRTLTRQGCRQQRISEHRNPTQTARTDPRGLLETQLPLVSATQSGQGARPGWEGVWGRSHPHRAEGGHTGTRVSQSSPKCKTKWAPFVSLAAPH